MDYEISDSDEYRDIMNRSLKDIINLLFEKDSSFLVVCNSEYINFNPELPDEIQNSFNDKVMFSIGGYTLESATISDKENQFSFNAGFGEDNFASTITMPLLAIQQIFVNEDILFVNFAEPQVKRVEKSMSALLNNPENQKFLKRR